MKSAIKGYIYTQVWVSMIPKYSMFYLQGLYKYKQIGSSYSKYQVDSADKSMCNTAQLFVRGAFQKCITNLYYSYKTLVNLLENNCY